MIDNVNNMLMVEMMISTIIIIISCNMGDIDKIDLQHVYQPNKKSGENGRRKMGEAIRTDNQSMARDDKG